MGRLLGAHDSDELDRPDLNKCPDCGCFFADNNCPFCGKECPEEFRAGNRKAVKKKRNTRTNSGRAVFVEWYHTWWFIGVMLFFAPFIGIVLLATSPHKKGVKIAIITLAVVWSVVSYFGVGKIVSTVTNYITEPVDTSMSREEYCLTCKDISAEEFYRNTDVYTEEFISMTLTVVDRITDMVGYTDGVEYTTYYVCRGESGNENFEILVRDCVKGNKTKYLRGDVIKVYGEGGNEITVYADANYVPITAPCVNAAYIFNTEYISLGD